ncbi:winged helix-turn-helix transcriptional regulator [Arthrobacter sp. CAU 1506]|uniref:MarR family winged helix-turn-helix transcriptional regulator n=1 Tax=Arthrobacter sp. CAU 1506 TaxID=2560052 RepID=UPI0010ABB6CD|nr:MarR family winged helix-turn-helix transcriptional regulator [Arthrobacter sp. CAU 1506]TJY69056.1 winged helix-turn-helix transcriptional regulator [Arthrobacter sp. CAU 1506]
MTGAPAAADIPRPDAIPGDLGWNLGMVLRGYQSRFEEAVAGMPEGIRGYQVLSAVVHRDPPNQQALGAHLAIDRTVLTYLLDRLVAARLVERVPAANDRRARKIVPTGQGRTVLSTYERRLDAAEQGLLSSLAADEVSLLSGLIQRLAMEIHRAQPNSNPCEAMDHLP